MNYDANSAGQLSELEEWVMRRSFNDIARKLVWGTVAMGVFCSLVSGAQAKIIEQRVEYKDGDHILEGWVVRDSAKSGIQPGVLVVHEWMGIVDHTKAQAQKLAKLGYVA